MRRNTSGRWGLNLDPTSLRARNYLGTLRTKLGSDLAMCERIPQCAEDYTRIWPRYKRENTLVHWGLNSNLTSLQAREYHNTLRALVDWPQINQFIFCMSRSPSGRLHMLRSPSGRPQLDHFTYLMSRSPSDWLQLYHVIYLLVQY